MKRLLVVALLAALVRLGWVYETRRPLRPPGAPPAALFVPAGATSATIGASLHAAGLVRHPLVFRALVLARGVGASLKAGEYALEGPLSLEELLERLVRGQAVRRDLTFPEGRNLDEMAAIAGRFGLDAQAFRRAASDPAPIRDLDAEASDLEGYLFPDTYDVPARAQTEAELVARMLRRFREVIAPERERIAASGLTLRELVTLASLVELETARAEERARIAAVFLNRLGRGMRLQTDPTVIYALRLAGRWDGNIRKRDLEIDSPYNTYRQAGLPPGPIGAPGREAILAVLEPAPVKDLYFVSRNDGSHYFSETLAEHERAVDRYQRRRRSSSDAS